MMMMMMIVIYVRESSLKVNTLDLLEGGGNSFIPRNADFQSNRTNTDPSDHHNTPDELPGDYSITSSHPRTSPKSRRIIPAPRFPPSTLRTQIRIQTEPYLPICLSSHLKPLDQKL